MDSTNNEKTINVHSIETFGTQEGPGIRLVIFLQGCNLRCIFCHNPDAQATTKNKLMTEEKIFELLKKQKEYFSDKEGHEGGITFSGGEPLMHADKLLPLFKKLKERGYHVAIDTSGSRINDSVKKLLEFTDLVLLDVKHTDKNKYKQITGGNIDTFNSFFAYCEEKKKEVWLRYVLMPRFTDDKEGIEDIGKRFKDYSCIKRIEILPYHTGGVSKYKELGMEYKYKDTKPPTTKEIEQAKQILEKYFENVFVR